LELIKTTLVFGSFNSVFLKDEHNLLVNAQEKTKALGQLRFESINDINKVVVLGYVKEAIENKKASKEVKPDRSKKKTVIPPELQTELNNDKELLSSFNALQPSKQEYCEHIETTKREPTKLSRLEKIKPMILHGVLAYMINTRTVRYLLKIKKLQKNNPSKLLFLIIFLLFFHYSWCILLFTHFHRNG
jgi:uncharacterized protein YdeI (YjbR/CyaY-like superfamily)